MSGGAKQVSHKLRVTDRAAALLRTLHPHIKKKVRSSFQAIMANPYLGKALTEELSGLRSYRVSRYRIIYRLVQERQIEIVAVGPRERIYEDTYRVLKKEVTKAIVVTSGKPGWRNYWQAYGVHARLFTCPQGAPAAS